MDDLWFSFLLFFFFPPYRFTFLWEGYCSKESSRFGVRKHSYNHYQLWTTHQELGIVFGALHILFLILRTIQIVTMIPILDVKSETQK